MGLLSRRLAPLVWAAALGLASWQALAQGAAEATVKAAFLYKFAGYVEWPAQALAQPDAPLVIGVMGADEVAAELEKLLPGRLVNGHRVAARRVRPGESLRGVHLLFVGRGEPGLRAIATAAHAQGVLVVSETERGLEAGSAINFVNVEERVGFEVSLESAERSGLRISSRMLAVARRVVGRS